MNIFWNMVASSKKSKVIVSLTLSDAAKHINLYNYFVKDNHEVSVFYLLGSTDKGCIVPSSTRVL